MGHIILILAYTFVCILHFNFPDMGLYITYLRTGTAWTFISGACDLFLTCMIWFFLDDEQTPSIMIHGEISYAIINVTQPMSNSISDSYLSDDEKQISEEDQNYAQSFRVSDLMIAQFFDKKEDSNQKWGHIDYANFEEYMLT